MNWVGVVWCGVEGCIRFRRVSCYLLPRAVLFGAVPAACRLAKTGSRLSDLIRVTA